MSLLLPYAASALELLWRMSWQASLLAVLVMLLGRAMGMPARLRMLLWLLVLARLVLPVLPQSRVSLFNLAFLPSSSHAPSSAAVSPASPAAPATGDLSTPPSPPLAEEEGMVDASRPTRPTPAAPPPAASEHLPAASKVFSAAPALPPAADPVWNVQRVLAILWLAGVMTMLAFTFAASLRLRRMLRRCRAVEEAGKRDLLEACRRDLGVRRPIALAASPDLASPALVGLWRPRLLLPRHVLERFSEDELRLVFFHELTHYKRWDIPLNYLLALLHALHWFNPVLHLAFARLRHDRELACDESVMARLEDAGSYGRTILKLLELLASAPAARWPGAVGILESKSLLKRRMAMIASFRPYSRWMALPLGGLMLGLGALALTDAASRGAEAGEKAEKAAVAKAEEDKTAKGAEATQTEGKAASAGKAKSVISNDAASEAVNAALAKPMTMQGVEGTSFELVLKYISEKMDINLFVDWKALEAMGVDKNTPITLNLPKEVPAKKLLELILKQAGGDQLSYVVDQGVLQVTAVETATRNVVVRIYKIDDLLEQYRDKYDAVATGPGGGSRAAPRSEAQNDESTAMLLMNVIQGTVSPETWREQKDQVSTSSMRFFNNKLIVQAPPKVHDEIYNLLKMLREEDGNPPRKAWKLGIYGPALKMLREEDGNPPAKK